MLEIPYGSEELSKRRFMEHATRRSQLAKVREGADTDGEDIDAFETVELVDSRLQVYLTHDTEAVEDYVIEDDIFDGKTSPVVVAVYVRELRTGLGETTTVPTLITGWGFPADAEFTGYCWDDLVETFSDTYDIVRENHEIHHLHDLFDGHGETGTRDLDVTERVATTDGIEFEGNLTIEVSVEHQSVATATTGIDVRLVYGCPWDAVEDQHVVSRITYHEPPGEFEDTIKQLQHAFQTDPYQDIPICTVQDDACGGRVEN